MHIHEFVLPLIVLSYIAAFVIFAKTNNKGSDLESRIDRLNKQKRF